MRKYQRPEQSIITRRAVEDMQEDQAAQLAAAVKAVQAEPTLAGKIWDENQDRKRINGHSPEYVAAGFDESVEEIFPPDGLTLYVGDPWQKLDRKGVVIMDYEFGPIAEFQDDRSRFLDDLDRRLSDLRYAAEYTHDVTIQSFLSREVSEAETLYQEALSKPIAEYPRITEKFSAMKLRVEEEIQREAGDSSDPIDAVNISVRDLWYLAVHGARAIDVLDWEMKLKSVYDEYANDLPKGLTAEDRQNLLRRKKKGLITEIRMKKTAKDAHVVAAMFPYLPFKEECFDRLVAFWSISTYVFPSLERKDMQQYWEAIYRVLKPGGKAYISPFFEGNEDNLFSTLTEFAEQHPGFSYSFDDNYNPHVLEIIKKQQTEV